jgi:hypothetical protein
LSRALQAMSVKDQIEGQCPRNSRKSGESTEMRMRSAVTNRLLLSLYPYRCYNCGEFANHVAAKCHQQPQPKKCHRCKAVEHLIADCPFIIHSSTEKSVISAKNLRNKANNKTSSETTINSDGLSTHTDRDTFSDTASEENNIQTAITAWLNSKQPFAQKWYMKHIESPGLLFFSHFHLLRVLVWFFVVYFVL